MRTDHPARAGAATRTHATRGLRPLLLAALLAALLALAACGSDDDAPPPEIEIRDDGGTVLVSTSDVDFGTTTADKTFTINNIGDGTLSIGSTSFTGAGASQFSVVAAPPSTLAAGGSATFQIRFTSDFSFTTHLATFALANNDPDEGSYDFGVFGYAS